MIDFIKQTGLTFIAGQTLHTSDLNTINDTLNNVVDAVNKMLSGKYDVNIEHGIPKTGLSILEALHKMNRRGLGMKVRFLNTDLRYKEYSFIGDSIGDESWYNLNLWSESLDNIDGGTW